MKPTLSDFLELTIEKVSNGDGDSILLRAVLLNKSSQEVEVFFDGRVYQSAGGFRVSHGYSEIRHRLSGTVKYNVLPSGYGLLPGHGQKEFDLSIDPSRHEMPIDSGSIKVLLLIHGVYRDGSYTELTGDDAILVGHWSHSTMGE